MCGIAGIIYKSRNCQLSESKQSLSLMMNTISHRGPDDHGMSFFGFNNHENRETKNFRNTPNCEYRVALGHRRLSIIDLSENGRQPMVNKENTLEIIFNGEIYNYIELKETYFNDDRFFTETDTEVLMTCYEKWGIDMLSKLDGMFSFAILDKKQNQLIFARDAMGIKPFYYSETDSEFLFGSEPKAIKKVIKSALSLNSIIASEFLIMGISDHDENTFYKEIKQLPGGHFMIYDLKTHDKIIKKYWHAPQINKTISSDIPSEYWKIAKEAIKRQLRSDVRLGTSLSGGIDSSVILSLASEILGEHSQQYSALTYVEKGFIGDESEDAKKIAKSAGLNWLGVEVLTENLCEEVEKMVCSMEEPFSTLSMFAQYKVMEYAKNIGIKVMLDGQGGDEIYLGYPRVAQFVLMEYLKQGKLRHFYNELIGLKAHASLPIFRSLTGNLFFSTRILAIGKNIRSLEKYVHKDLLHQYRKEISEDLYSSKNLQDRQVDELTKYCLPRLLRYADRNSMAFSIESRVPHLSNLIIDFALTTPIEWRVHNGWTKYYVRKAAEKVNIPNSILFNTLKRGFEVPQNEWVKKLNPLINQYIENASNFKTILKLDNIQKDINSNLTESNASKLWRTISFMAFLQNNNLSI